MRDMAYVGQAWTWTIDSLDVVVGGDVMTADLIIENAQGWWYGVDLGGGAWDYLQNNGKYVPACQDDPVRTRRSL